MRVDITIMVENTTPVAGLVGEYGFSALVRVDDHPILFDTGSRDGLFKNASSLSIDLETIEDVVLSHGHFDHTGGLRALMEMRGDRRLYTHPHAFGSKHLALPEGRYKYIGVPIGREELRSLGGLLIETPGVYELLPGVILTGEIPRITGYEDTGGKFVCRGEVDSEWETDHLLDDQALVIDHPEGLVVISGCAHAGLINTLGYARKVTGRERIKAFIGGTHLMTAKAERIDKTIRTLKEYNIERLVVGHCTGFYPAARLYAELGDIVQKCDAGTRIKI